MSALELQKSRRGKSMARPTRELNCSVPGCKYDGTANSRNGLRVAASHDAFVVGHFAGSLCSRHANEWKQAWEEALGL